MMFCTKCGNEMQQGSKFCPKCGQNVEGSASVNNYDTNSNLRVKSNKKALMIILSIVLVIILGAVSFTIYAVKSSPRHKILGTWVATTYKRTGSFTFQKNDKVEINIGNEVFKGSYNISVIDNNNISIVIDTGDTKSVAGKIKFINKNKMVYTINGDSLTFNRKD